MTSNMKIDDAALSSYLVEHLQPLTEADPHLLAKYVAALLKNNKPKKELEILCVDKLGDFLGDGTKPFVKNLFHAFEDGTISTSNDECDLKVAEVASAMPVNVAAKMVGKSGDITDSRSCSQPEKLPTEGTGIFSDLEEEGTDDEDDDRNHKHRRRVSRSRSLDRDAQDYSFKKRNKPAINGLPIYDASYSTAESSKGLSASHMERDGPLKRQSNREQAFAVPSRLGGEGNQRGVLRGASFFRGDGLGPRFEQQNSLSRGVLGRGRGAPSEPWGVREQRTALDGLDFNLPLIPLGPPFNPYSSRPSSSRGNLPQSPWGGFGQFPGITNGPLDQALPMNGVMQGTKGFSLSATLGLTVGRSRCPDFEERGYCLRGDLCPMEHGANRIVVEDVQSLSKFNLPLAPPSGRGMTLSSMSVSTSSLSPYSSNTSIAARATNMPMVDDPVPSKGTFMNSSFSEPDLYDPDQPLLNKEQPSALADGFKRLSSFRTELEDDEGEAASLKRRRGQSPDEVRSEKFSIGATMQGLTPGLSVWNRIKHINQGDGTAECSTRPSSVFVDHSKAHKGAFVEDYEPQDLGGMRENHRSEKEEKSVRSSSTVGVSSVSQGEAGLHFTESINHKSRGRQNMGLGSERAQRTLYVGCIPSTNSRKELLKAHFQKFGEIVDIRVPSQGDRAFVQFSRREDAEAALKSPEAVMGNRFIRLSWAKRDSVPFSSADDDLVKSSSTGHTMTIGFGCPQGLSTEVSLTKAKRQAVAVSATSELNAFKNAGKAINQPVPSTVPMKKQEELELMKEELRRKQDELAQKREDFRRKLERLSKQGSGGVLAGVHGDQVSNLNSSDPKVDMRGDQSSNKQLNLEKLDTGLSASVEKAISSTDSGVPKTSVGLVQASAGSSNHLSQRGARGHSLWPGGTGIGFAGPLQWSPMRYKLDNRTTTFRVLPPFPDGLLDVTALTEHFSFFGDLSNVEVEDVDKKVQGFKVTFYTRSAAEQAYLQGRSYQGTSLCFSWTKPSSSISAGASSAGSVQVNANNDNSSQDCNEAAVGLGSSEAKLLKNQRMFPGNGSRVDELAVVKNSGDIPEPGHSEVAERGLHPQAETNPTVSADAGSMSGLCREASSL